MSLGRLFLLIGLLLTLAITVLLWRVADLQWSGYRSASRSVKAVQELRVALVAAEMVSRERGPANGVLGDATPANPERAVQLAQARARTDRALEDLRLVLAGLGREDDHLDARERHDDVRRALVLARAELDRVAARPQSDRRADEIRQAVRNMVAVVPLLTPAIRALSRDAQAGLPVLADTLGAARLSSDLREHAGQLGSLFIPALTRRQPFTADERDAIQRVSGRIDVLRDLLEARLRAPGQSPAVMEAFHAMNDAYFHSGRQLLDRTIAAGLRDGDFGMDAATFTSLYVPRMNAIVGLRDALLADADAAAVRHRAEVRRLLAVVMAGGLALLAVLSVSLWRLNVRVLRPLARTTRALQALARGNHDAPLPQLRVRDEIAEVVDAVAALRRHSLERLALERERDALIAKLRDQSSTDFLTGLPNRRAFLSAAARELAAARRQDVGVAMVAIDVDHFKRVNDAHGHAMGDRVLAEVAAALRRLLREGDLVARFGGEEFVVLLARCSDEDGAQFAERIRRAIGTLRVPLDDGTSLGVTVSLGVAGARAVDADLDVLLRQADHAMYRAKQDGRDRVAVHG